jgi:hypothetical protein
MPVERPHIFIYTNTYSTCSTEEAETGQQWQEKRLHRGHGPAAVAAVQEQGQRGTAAGGGMMGWEGGWRTTRGMADDEGNGGRRGQLCGM